MKAPRPRPPVFFDATPARVAFKRVAGDASRHLNTLWVGVETLAAGNEVRPPWLLLGWTMPQVAQEWLQTRDFIAKAGMATVLDGIDQYLKVLARINLFADPAVVQQMKGTAKKSSGARFTIPERFSAVNDHHGKPATAPHVAAIDLLATWRNHFVHGDRRFPLPKASRATLEQADHYFRSQQGGADIRAILAQFDNRSGPRPEDMITLISAAQLGVAALDQHLLFSAAPRDYAYSLMAFMLSESEDPPALLERIFRSGGKISSGTALALMMKNKFARAKGALSPVSQMLRQDFDAVLAMGRNRASEVFGIPRP